MIIDISYIKRALEIDVEDSIIKYFIDFYFDYICEHINVETSLDEEDILNDNLETPVNNPNISNDDLTIFQEMYDLWYSLPSFKNEYINFYCSTGTD